MTDKYISGHSQIRTAVDEVDFCDRLKPSAVLQYFQDIATTNAEDLGIGYYDMLKKEQYWIISRTSFIINRFPKVDELINVSTYPSKPRRVDANRNYVITDVDGKELVLGTSKWCVIGINDRAIKRCDDCFPFDADKFNPFEPVENGNPKLPAIESFGIALSEPFIGTVMLTDLDRNRHMNNAKYADAVFNACDMQKLDNYDIKRFDINYISELFAGDTYKIYRVSPDDENTYFEASGEKDGETKKVIFRARIVWKKRQ